MAEKVSPVEALPPASRAYGEIGPRSQDPHWGMVVDRERCIGCWSCAVICKSENDLPLGAWWNRIMTDGDSLDQPHEDVGGLGLAWVPLACQHCENAPCTKVCPVSHLPPRRWPGDDGQRPPYRLSLPHRVSLRRAHVQSATRVLPIRDRDGGPGHWGRSRRHDVRPSPAEPGAVGVWSCLTGARSSVINDPGSRVATSSGSGRSVEISARALGPPYVGRAARSAAGADAGQPSQRALRPDGRCATSHGWWPGSLLA
jgi:ferredoxin